ncbi:flagellar hook-length control protein FliK [Halomonas beimenensis]|uniref:Flagellar hook-length control protein FliK n=1 Tax=Halomonas beimenensis TaxID=475662 RepID=A0A291PCU4_9GAMM|nr:flagellar hook-length control protein FliK [Halomonas beimenensis]ATJ84669.1 flagellar hook-length control protein FliK [Halomonas beimenensis]
MDIQQILAGVKGQASAPKGGDGAPASSESGDFAAALAALAPAGAAGPAEGLEAIEGTPQARRQALAALAALVQGDAPGQPLNEGLDSLATLPAGAGVPEALLAKLTEAARRAAASPAEGETDATPPPGLTAVMERLALIQDAGQAPDEVAAETTVPVMSPALDQTTAQLAAGKPATAHVTTARDTPDNPAAQGALPSALGKPPRAPGTGQPPSSPLPTAVETAAKATDGQAPLTPSATPSPQAMAEALTARREGAPGESPNALLGQAGLSGQSSALPGSASGAPGATPPAPQQAALTAPVNSPAWPRQLGQQLIRLGQGGGEQRIEMQLHPAELGPLSVTLKVGDQGAQAQFLSAHAQVRQAVEQAIPQLREALAEQGIALGETSVGEQRTGQGEGDGTRFAEGTGTPEDPEGEDAARLAGTVEASTPGVSLDGRVDLYA